MITVYYRLCDIPSTNPSPVFQEDKFRLNELCLRSFVKAFKSVQPKVVFLCDHCNPGRYTEMVERICPFEKELHFTTIGINESCLLQYKLYEESHEDAVLFQECDYLFVPEAGQIIEAAVHDLGYLSPYDHPDKYDLGEHSLLKLAGNKHWKTTISTTSTFATTREYFLKNKDLFLKHGYIDHQRWVEINERGDKLWTPIPSLATHMVESCIAPVIDWKKQYETII